MIPAWKKVWREGIVPLVTTDALKSLQKELQDGGARIIQGATTQPPPLEAIVDWSCEAACGTGWLGWQGKDMRVGDVEENFAKLCCDVDQRLGEPAAIRYFLNWFDDTPREEMVRELLSELAIALKGRE